MGLRARWRFWRVDSRCDCLASAHAPQRRGSRQQQLRAQPDHRYRQCSHITVHLTSGTTGLEGPASVRALLAAITRKQRSDNSMPQQRMSENSLKLPQQDCTNSSAVVQSEAVSSPWQLLLVSMGIRPSLPVRSVFVRHFMLHRPFAYWRETAAVPVPDTPPCS